MKRIRFKIASNFEGIPSLDLEYKAGAVTRMSRLTRAQHRPLRAMGDLTPGDFHVVRDQFALYPADEVRQECLRTMALAYQNFGRDGNENRRSDKQPSKAASSRRTKHRKAH